MKRSKVITSVLSIHLVMILLSLIFLPIIFNFAKSKGAQLVASIVVIGIYILMFWGAAVDTGFRDRLPEKFKGLYASLIASIPSLILVLLYTFSLRFSWKINWFEVAMRLWMNPYVILYTLFEKTMPLLAYITLLPMPIVFSLGYINGANRRAKALKK